MRTTIEIEDKHWARLLDLAAKRQEGLSGVLAEAIDTYLAAVDQNEANRRAALALRGSLSGEEAEEMDGAIARLRGTW
jgi:predicted transcriptional regulator